MVGRTLAVIVLALSGACSLAPRPERNAPGKGVDIARIEQSDEDDQPPAVFDPEERRRLEQERFPGLERLDLVRVLLWPEDPSGPCWSELESPAEMEIHARYAVEGERRDLTARGIRELREQGWLGLYRTPAGTGFERKVPFESIDLTVETAYACRCNLRPGDQREKKIPVRLRFRWTGKGALPEVSGRLVGDGESIGLKMTVAPGRLMTYEFPVREPFPFPQPVRCGGTMSLQLLVEPPML